MHFPFCKRHSILYFNSYHRNRTSYYFIFTIYCLLLSHHCFQVHKMINQGTKLLTFMRSLFCFAFLTNPALIQKPHSTQLSFVFCWNLLYTLSRRRSIDAMQNRTHASAAECFCGLVVVRGIE